MVAVGVLASVRVAESYGGDDFWPGLVTASSGRSSRSCSPLPGSGSATACDSSRRPRSSTSSGVTEVRRRLEPVRTSSRQCRQPRGHPEPQKAASRGTFLFANPQLLEGAWTASASRLSELIADYELIADLATAYGRIEELR